MTLDPGNEAADSEIIPEIRTRRLVVLDEDGLERIVGEVIDGHAELRLELPGSALGRRTAVTIFTVIPDGETGPGLGVHIAVEGDAAVELATWRSPSVGWTAGLYVDGVA